VHSNQKLRPAQRHHKRKNQDRVGQTCGARTERQSLHHPPIKIRLIKRRELEKKKKKKEKPEESRCQIQVSTIRWISPSQRDTREEVPRVEVRKKGVPERSGSLLWRMPPIKGEVITKRGNGDSLISHDKKNGTESMMSRAEKKPKAPRRRKRRTGENASLRKSSTRGQARTIE